MREQPREPGDQRHREEADQRELPVHDEQHDRDADDHQHALDPLHHPPADEVADRIEVVGRTRDHLAGRVLVVERARVAEVRAVQQLAHARLGADADAGGRVAARVVRVEAERGEDQDRAEVGDQRAGLLRHDRVVDRARDQDRDRERQDRRRERADEADRDHPPLLAPEAEQPPDGGDEVEVGRVDGVRAGGAGRFGQAHRPGARRFRRLSAKASKPSLKPTNPGSGSAPSVSSSRARRASSFARRSRVRARASIASSAARSAAARSRARCARASSGESVAGARLSSSASRSAIRRARSLSSSLSGSSSASARSRACSISTATARASGSQAPTGTSLRGSFTL